MNTAEYKFEISREFDAPISLVWKVYTEAEHLKNWFAGPGMDMTHCTIDLKAGGMMHYRQEGNGLVLWGRFIFKEIDEPDRLTYLSSFSNEKAEIAPNPFSGAWPAEIMNVMTLTENNGKTTVHLSAVAYNASQEEIDGFKAANEGMNQGYIATMDKLENYLSKL